MADHNPQPRAILDPSFLLDTVRAATRALYPEARIPETAPMTKIAYNACYGGFNLSRAAVLRAREISGNPKWGGCILAGEPWGGDRTQVAGQDYGSVDSDVPRHDPVLIQVIEELGDAANGLCASLAIEELPSGTPYRIDEYDGNECVKTADSYEWTIAP